MPKRSPLRSSSGLVESKKSWARTRRLFVEQSKAPRTCQGELDCYLIELVEQKTWIEGVKFMLADPDTPQRPWPCYRDEHAVWV